MATIRPLELFDLLKYNNINLDLLTETFYTSFYCTYLAKWSEYCVIAENSVSTFQGYLLGKVEGDKHDEHKMNWHGKIAQLIIHLL
jgi:N-terminal acetyltransferase B complex catalytic subunit